MFIVPLLLSMGLDMTLPEFEPETDASGNYIVGYYDVSTDAVIVEELEENPVVEDNSSVADSLSVAPVRIEETPLEETPLLGAELNTEYLTLSKKRHASISSESGSFYIRYNSSSNYYIDYILLSSGVTYDLDYSGDIYTGGSIADDSQIYSYSGSTITPSSDIYLMQYHRSGYYLNVSISQSGGEPDDPSGNDPEPDDPSGNDPDIPSDDVTVDLTNVENKLDRVIVLQRSILFVLLMSFLYPLVISIKNNIVGGDK